MKKSLLNIIKNYMEENRAIKFAYLFGSHARGDDGPLSDIDLAIYLDNRFDFFSCRLKFMEELSRILKAQPFDLLVLNNSPLTLQYEIIRDGVVLKENKPKRILFETEILRKYLDTEPIRALHITSIKKRFGKERNLGQ